LPIGEARAVQGWQGVFLVLAGVGAGLTGSIAGLASLISYPALLATGLAPVTANVTNTVALVFNNVGSVARSQPELRGRRTHIRSLGAAGVLGGLVGGLLLLATSSRSFELLVPGLIGLASLAIMAPARPAPVAHERRRHESLPVLLGTGLIGVYGGYFGAAAGVLLLALLLTATGESLPVCTALKNVVMGLVNLVAAIVFAALGRVDWAAMVPLALGLLAGGLVGPMVVRRAPVRVLRSAIGVAGVGLALWLGWAAYR
jgi:uncharacterized membrane protein YfcA